MPGWFITAIVFLILAVLVYAASIAIRPVRHEPDGPDRSPRPMVRMGAVILGVIALLCLVLASFDIVGTRNVGIVTTFGKPVGERGAGLALHAPWSKVSEMDAAIQLQSFDGNSFAEPGTAIKVRLGNNSAAYVEANLNWRIREDAAGHLFQDYRTFDNIRQNLVDKQLQVALSKEFSTFNPQLSVDAVDPTKPQPTSNGPTGQVPRPAQGADLPAMATRVKGDLQDAVGQNIEIIDVRVPGIFYDDATQQRIDEFNRKVQETKNAQQDVATATQQRLAAEQRAAQAPPNIQVAIFNCVMEAVAQHKPNEAAGCWGQIGTGGNPLIQIPVPPR